MNKFLIFYFITFVATENIDSTIENKKIERTIDLTSQLVKTNVKATIENTGSNSVKSYLIILSEKEKNHLAFIGAQFSNHELKVIETSVSDKEDSFYKVELPDGLSPGKSITIEIEEIFGNYLEPYPAKISQGEKQLVQYNGNHYFYSPYTTVTQTTVISLSSPNVEFYSKLKLTVPSDTTITYGPYENVAPFSNDAMRIHYENNSPFLTINFMERVIEVSHWGNIAVEETLDIYHAGAKLKGTFSRYDYQREHNTYSSIKAFKTILPSSAKDVYYRDEIGNISTSHMRVQDDAVELELRPRFPLFGGWKTHYQIGYNTPSYEYLYNNGESYILKMRFLDHVFDDMYIEELRVKVILPEGIKNIELHTPYDVEREPDSLHYTYLDTVGRPVISVYKKNLVESHIQDFELHYTFPSILMLQEPLLVVIGFFILFFCVILYVRLDLTISKDDATEAKMRVSSHCEMVHNHNDKRAKLYEKLEEEIQKLKSTKDISQAQTNTKKLFNGIKEETQIINDFASKIRSDSSEFAEKILELQKHEKILKDCITMQVSNAEKLVSGKINKQAYMDSDNNLNKKKEEELEKIKVILQAI